MAQYRYKNPVNQPWNITSNTGSRVDPVFGYNANHKGIDIAIPVGTQVMAATNGRVIYSQIDKSSSGGFGNYIVIKHNDGTYTTYGHLSTRDVKVGQKVETGQLIGLSGNTGKSTGPHLHFQITEGDPLKSGYKVINPTEVTDGIKSQPIQPKINSDKNENYINSELGDLLSQSSVDQDNPNLSPSENPITQSENIPQEEVSVDAVKDMLATEDMKQTADFMSEVKLQLPSMMGVMVARLALGEDIELVSADMASRLIATSAINAYAENNWSSSFAS